VPAGNPLRSARRLLTGCGCYTFRETVPPSCVWSRPRHAKVAVVLPVALGLIALPASVPTKNSTHLPERQHRPDEDERTSPITGLTSISGTTKGNKELVNVARRKAALGQGRRQSTRTSRQGRHTAASTTSGREVSAVLFFAAKDKQSRTTTSTSPSAGRRQGLTAPTPVGGDG